MGRTRTENRFASRSVLSRPGSVRNRSDRRTCPGTGEGRRMWEQPSLRRVALSRTVPSRPPADRPMRVDRPSQTTQLLELLVAAAVVLPVGLFLYVAWANYRTLDTVATERVERTLDVLQEHALRVFQTIDRTIAETDEVVRGLSDEEIRAREPALHRRLKQTQESVPQIEAIWLFDRTGGPLV